MVIKQAPISGLSGMGGGTTGLSVVGGGLTIKAPFDMACNFDGNSATMGWQSGSVQDELHSTGSQGPLQNWSSTGGLDNGGHYAAAGGDTNDNKWDMPNVQSVEGNYIDGEVRDFDQYALSCWVKTTSTADSGHYTVYETILGDTSGNVFGGFGISQGKPCLTNATQDLIAYNTVNSGNWTHIGFLLEPTSLKLFINGEVDRTFTNVTWSQYLAFNQFCGTYDYGNAKIANLDAVVIWVDRNISEQDITDAYTIGNFSGI